MERLAPGRRKQAGRQPVHRPRSHPTGARAAGSCASRDRPQGNGGGASWMSRLPKRYGDGVRSEEHTSELQSLMRISYAVFCLKKKTTYSKVHTKNTTASSHQYTTIETTTITNTAMNIT